MKKLTLLGALALFATSIGAQSPVTDDSKMVEALLKEVQAQQLVIADNQAKIDAKLAAVAEAIRVADLWQPGRTLKMRLYLIAFFAVIFSALSLLSSRGQTSVPTILQAAAPTPAVVAKSPAAPEIDLKAALQLLQDMQATNAATIKKQEAALAVLDELEQAANELKIFSKRG